MGSFVLFGQNHTLKGKITQPVFVWLYKFRQICIVLTRARHIVRWPFIAAMCKGVLPETITVTHLALSPLTHPSFAKTRGVIRPVGENCIFFLRRTKTNTWYFPSSMYHIFPWGVVASPFFFEKSQFTMFVNLAHRNSFGEHLDDSIQVVESRSVEQRLTMLRLFILVILKEKEG